MSLSKRNMIILAATLVLILIIQLLRLSIGLNMDAMANNKDFIYNPDEATDLTADELRSCSRLKCLIIEPLTNSADLLNLMTVMQDMQIDPDTAAVVPGQDEIAAYDLVIVMGKNDYETSGFSDITSYVSEGGRLLYLSPGNLEIPDISANKSFFGIEAVNARQTVNVFDFATELLSGLTAELNISDIPALAGRITANKTFLTSDCQIHLTGGQDIPLIWERVSGGMAMVVNTGAYDSRMMRGLLTGAVSVLMDTVIYPVISSAVWQITNMPVDDRRSADVLSKNYSRNFSRYILDIWWVDMSTLLNKYHLKPTVSYVGSLAKTIEKPFVSPRISNSNTSNIFRSVTRFQGEFSFQGYNSIPLLVADTKPKTIASGWSDTAEIAAALDCSLSFLDELLPDYALETFVPTDYCLDEQTLLVVRNSMPNLKTICGAYDKSLAWQPESASSVFVQDFSVDVLYGLAMPLVSQSCFYDDATRFAMASAITTHGIINHRIAADEILDPEKCRGMLWEELFDEYRSLLAEIDKKYSWLTSDTAGTAAEKLRQAESLEVYFQVKDNVITITCDHFTSDARVLLVSEKPLRTVAGCDIVSIDSIRYLVILHNYSASLEVISD